MKIAYIGVPIGLGADRRGVEMAPDFFRHQGIVNMLSNISGCYDLGNVTSSIIAEEKYVANSKVKYLDTVVDITRQLRDKVASVIKQGYFPLVIGGDHSIGLGSCAGSSLAAENLGVIWFDAHGDLNTEETSPSGNLHGMPCAALMGLCKSSLNSVPSKIVPKQNLFWIGTRDLDEGEISMIEEYELHVYSSKLVREIGINEVIRDIESKMRSLNIDKIHLSIDIDGMDPNIVCGTGTCVNSGLLNGDFYTFIDRVFESKMVQSVDFVEYNKLLDDKDYTSAKWCIEALHYLGIKINGI